MLTQWFGRIRRHRIPVVVPIQCLDCTDIVGGACFIAQVTNCEVNRNDLAIVVEADTAVSAQLELLGRLNAQ